MRFSEHFGITQTTADDWFDPDLSVDTKLFVDPLLVLAASARRGVWSGAHDELIEHFTRCYELLAAGPSRGSPAHKSALSLLRFPEPAEFCLGYTENGTRGSGSAGKYAGLMVDGIAIAMAAGLTQPEHIEELGILTVGIGADRISDAVCNVLKARFVRYTQRVAARHGLPVEAHTVRNSRCDRVAGRWFNEEFDLPTRPDGRPVLLVPRRLLNRLPVLNAHDWFDSSINEDVRRDMNVRVASEVSKKRIVEVAARHPQRVRDWAAEIAADADPRLAYDFDADPFGVVTWQHAETYAAEHPIPTTGSITSVQQLEVLTRSVIDGFKHFIEHEGGWRLLWNDDGSEKYEEAAQLAFLGFARWQFRHHGVELDREVQLGRGPVDFKLSSGAAVRLLIEIKKLHNGDFWNGLESQLTSYMESDTCESGWLLALQYRSGGISKSRRRELPTRVARVNDEQGYRVSYSVVDATPKLSASRRRRRSASAGE